MGTTDQKRDIGVLAPAEQLSTDDLPLLPSSNGIALGQQVFFLGFPFGLTGHAEYLNDGYPLPFVKSGFVSAIPGDGEPLYIDGHNNIGFSGGPVVFRPIMPNHSSYHVAAVVSGYHNLEPVFGESGDRTGTTNPGFFIANHIEPAVDLIKGNPIGFKL